MFDVFYQGNKPNLFSHELPVRDIDHARALSRTRYFWMVNYLCDYQGFDFLWEPSPWQSSQIHVWPSQWQEDSGTWLCPKDPSQEHNYDHSVIPRQGHVPVYVIDHGDGSPLPHCEKAVRFVGNYLDTLRRLLKSVEHEYIWVVSSVCDYRDFDFTWHPSRWQQHLLHVFASEDQKFGDTFFVHVPSAREGLATVELLDWYSLNFVQKSVPRRPLPVVRHDNETHIDSIKQYKFTGPLAVFTNTDPPKSVPAVSLWRDRTRAVVPLSRSASSVIVPRDAQNFLKTQIYDYPWIDRSRYIESDSLLDVVFLSNGESCAEENWKQLQNLNLQNRLIRVDGVSGRQASQRAAALAAHTDFYFLVPAKLCVNPEFDWSWQPDRLQAPKHTIFHAHNPVTGLTYGHMAVIAYCRRLVLETVPQGLDFTMDQLHEVQPLISGHTTYDTDPVMAWRTAFREVIKLRRQHDLQPDVETDYRIKKWLAAGHDDEVSLWSRLGAQDGNDYYDRVGGVFDQLLYTYEWGWLDQWWNSKYSVAKNPKY